MCGFHGVLYTQFHLFLCNHYVSLSLSFSGFVIVSRTSGTMQNTSSDCHSNIYPWISLSGALTSFLHILVFTWHNFSSFQKTSLNMCYGTDLLQMNLTFSPFWNCLNFIFIFEGYSYRIWISGDFRILF